MNMKFLIVVTGYNCEQYVESCYNSLVNLKGGLPWRAFFVNDGSTDQTWQRIQSVIKDGRVRGVNFPDNSGAAKRRYEVIKNADPDEVCILLGMDDELLPDALNVISEQYAGGKWMTYGNWIDQNGSGLPANFEFDFPADVHAARSYRRHSYRSTAPNTFYAYLFHQIPVNDFKIDGKWIDSTTESEVMFSCMEMCGKERIGIIREKIYLYRRNLPGGTLKRLGKEYKYAILEKIQARPIKDKLQSLPFLHGVDDRGGIERNDVGGNHRLGDVGEVKWKAAHEALAKRRAAGTVGGGKSGGLADYGSHLKKCYVGGSVLDVGCGGQALKQHLPLGTTYMGVDPFPVTNDTAPVMAEDLNPDAHGADTVCCFAALDNVRNLSLALRGIQGCAKKNVIFLTGIGIDPDQYHTQRIDMDFLDAEFYGWKKTVCEQLAPKVYLIEYTK